MKSLLLLLLLVGSCLGQGVEYTSLFSRCFSTLLDNILGGVPCLNISNAKCFDVKIDLALGTTQLFSQSLPIPVVLQALQLASTFGQTEACVPIDDPLGLLKNQNCIACMNITSYSFNPSGSLHLCSDAKFSCNGSSALTKFDLPFNDLPCVDIEDCQFLDCPANCSGHGKCNSLGICACEASYYGFDCSIQIKGNCAKQGNTEACWDLKTTMDSACYTTFTVGSTQTLLSAAKLPGSRVPLTPCKALSSGTSSPFRVTGETSGICEYCITLTNLTYDTRSGKLAGCKSVDTWCGNSLVSSSTESCSTILENVSCDEQAPPPPQPEPVSQTEPQPQSQPQSVPPEEENNNNLWFIVGLGVCVALLALGTVGAYYYRKATPQPSDNNSLTLNEETETVQFSEDSSSVELSSSSA